MPPIARWTLAVLLFTALITPAFAQPSLLWQRTLDLPATSHAADIAYSPQWGPWLLLSYVPGVDGEQGLVRLNASGEIVQVTDYPGVETSLVPVQVLRLDNGSWVIGGSTTELADRHAYLMVDPPGQALFGRTYDHLGDTRLVDLDMLPNGDIMLAHEAAWPGHHSQAMIVERVAPDTEPIWTYTDFPGNDTLCVAHAMRWIGNAAVAVGQRGDSAQIWWIGPDGEPVQDLSVENLGTSADAIVPLAEGGYAVAFHDGVLPDLVVTIARFSATHQLIESYDIPQPYLSSTLALDVYPNGDLLVVGDYYPVPQPWENLYTYALRVTASGEVVWFYGHPTPSVQLRAAKTLPDGGAGLAGSEGVWAWWARLTP